MRRRAVTIIELLFVIAILGLLMGVAFGAYAGTLTIARETRTKAILAKIDHVLGEKWESYKTRAVPIRLPQNSQPAAAARVRLYALRELMRLELPDRISDVTTSNATPITLQAWPSLNKNYRRRAVAGWTPEFEGAECLYLILAATRDEEDSALSWFSPSELGDVDGDGMPEVLDAWGNPIEWIRWPRGFVVENDCVTPITSDAKVAPDPFDPLHTDPRWSDSDPTFAPFALKPLIFSTAGIAATGSTIANEPYAIRVDRGLDYGTTSPANDPYVDLNPPLGAPIGPDHGAYLTNQR